MSNIIKGIDFGMGYEIATKWEPGLQGHHPENRDAWRRSWNSNQEDFDECVSAGWTYRRPLPILANHPEAIPLEPGEVLKVGERYLTRDGQDTGALVWNVKEDDWPYLSEALNLSFCSDGHQFKYSKSEVDIIARLPKVAREAEFCFYKPTGAELPYPRKEWSSDCGLKVFWDYEVYDGITHQTVPPSGKCMKCGREKKEKEAEPLNIDIFPCGVIPPGTILVINDGKVAGKITNVKPEAEKAKEEKVSGLKIQDKLINWPGFDAPGADTYIPLSEAARIAQLPEVQAEVKRQEEAKRIGPGDWFIYQNAIYRCVRVGATGSLHVGGYGFPRDRCCKLDLPPDLIAALNAEIDAKAGG